MNIIERLQEIKRLSEIASKANREAEQHKKVVKDYANSKQLVSLTAGDGRYYNKKWIPKLEFNEDKATLLAKSKELDPQSLSTAKLDPIKFEALAKLGVITEDEFLACFDDKGNVRWSFSEKKLESV